jgi:hypothetical protein
LALPSEFKNLLRFSFRHSVEQVVFLFASLSDFFVMNVSPQMTHVFSVWVIFPSDAQALEQ